MPWDTIEQMNSEHFVMHTIMFLQIYGLDQYMYIMTDVSKNLYIIADIWNRYIYNGRHMK